MTMWHRNFRIPALAAAGLCVLAGLTACEETPPTPIADEQVQEIDADYIVWEMENQLTLNGVRSGYVLADSAFGVRDSAVVHMSGVTMSLYNDAGVERARVTSETGIFNQSTEELMAHGNVVLTVSDQGVRIESAMLGYDPIRDEIWSDSVTYAEIEGSQSNGTCFRSDLQFSAWSVCTPRGEIPQRPASVDTTTPPGAGLAPGGTPQPMAPTPPGGAPDPVTGAAPATSGAPVDTSGAGSVPPDTTDSGPVPADTTGAAAARPTSSGSR